MRGMSMREMKARQMRRVHGIEPKSGKRERAELPSPEDEEPSDEFSDWAAFVDRGDGELVSERRAERRCRRQAVDAVTELPLEPPPGWCET